MGAKRQVRYGQFAVAFLALGLFQVTINPSLLPTSRSLALGVSLAIGLGLALSLAFGLGLIVRQRLIRSRIGEIESTEVAWDSVPMNDEERRWDGEMRWLGFRPLGSMRTQAPHGEAGMTWVYADLDGRIAADINRLTASANFCTLFVDDFEATTRNRKLMPKISTPHYEALNVDAPGHALTPAYQAHVARLHALAPVHGDAIHFMTIGDVLAAEERTKATLLPEVMASRRVQNLLGALLFVAAPAVLLVVLGLQLLDG